MFRIRCPHNFWSVWTRTWLFEDWFRPTDLPDWERSPSNGRSGRERGVSKQAYTRQRHDPTWWGRQYRYYIGTGKVHNSEFCKRYQLSPFTLTLKYTGAQTSPRSFPLIHPSVPSRKVPLGDIDPRTSSIFSILRRIVYNPTIRLAALNFWKRSPETLGRTIPSLENIFDNILVWEKLKAP